MTGAIRHALALNLRHHGQQFGADNLRWSDLYVDVITARKWVHSVDPETAVYVARRALQEAADEGDRQAAPLKDAALCLRHSLTQASVPYGKWSETQAEAFVTAALLDVA
ncbi:hypothetical protein OHA79_50835 (plasmid) [Streptomyces sp. NBC_00841]|uniref:hypothetical protein n=1 Tax=unclassified Streptomyces TaxID=2593676 RepID=UPI0022556B86|nr:MULTISPECIES: hypothetical protein [unclassified Streptomyces]MCX4538445.1 hypothetical protein [Streptomyces sp. NBC_01669]WSA05724.1 hypothetical protein OHA79_50835 [Streptomyces sp. NBC_00841]